MYCMIRAIGLILILGHAPVVLGAPPTATGNVTSPECVDAAVLAQSMFASIAPRLYAPLQIPPGVRSALVLGASESDISGGDALQATDAFEKLPQQTNRSVYWSRAVDAGKRIVVAETAVGWRGDMYSLYLLDGAIEPSSFLNSLEVARHDALSVPVVSDSWRPPLVFQLPDGGKKWFIDVGQPHQVLANWRVHAAEATQPSCTILFLNPSGSTDKGLPTSVRTLVAQLDEALGPGHDEGTLQPTARQRLHAQHVLANAAYRPWALSDGDVYNSRSEVDAGLEEWALAIRSRSRLRGDIVKTYPKAERSLSAYYVRTFGLSAQKADEVSAWVLDLVFRSFFVFSNDGDYFRYDGVRTNPWPDKPAMPEIDRPTSRFQPTSLPPGLRPSGKAAAEPGR